MAKETVICTYRVRADAEDEFRALLDRHWTTLHGLGFVADEESFVLRSLDEPTYVEIFTWAERGYHHAREHPDVLAIWGAMDPLLEERGGHEKWEFPHYRRVRGAA
jgi:hypothetical protein